MFYFELSKESDHFASTENHDVGPEWQPQQGLMVEWRLCARKHSKEFIGLRNGMRLSEIVSSNERAEKVLRSLRNPSFD